MSSDQNNRPGWRCRLPGPFGHKHYRRWKNDMAARSADAFDALVTSLGPGDICIDAGANYGVYTRKFAQTGATVHAFEPDPDTFEQLQANVGDMPNVILHQTCLGDTPGMVTLYRAKNYDSDKKRLSLGSSVARTDRFAMDRGNSVQVEQVDFFAFAASLGQRIRLAKIDIEGSEWPILEDLASGRGDDLFDAVYVETHERFAPFRLMPKVLRLQAHFATRKSPKVNLTWV